MNTFSSKLQGALHGAAIGDGMGAPVEGWSAEQIAEKFARHDFNQFLPATHGKDPARGKGDGRITDDTLMTEALMRAYGRCENHMDAYGFSEYLVPEFTATPVWVPEYGKEMTLIGRLNPVEKYTVLRLTEFKAYPRHAGIGNAINCCVAMYIMPVGAVNAGSPRNAFNEAVSLAMAETDSYAVEGAAVLAAAYAEAFKAGACIDAVCACAQALAKDGTKLAIESVLSATSSGDELPVFIKNVREAFTPFDPKVGNPGATPGAVNTDQPSRILSIEEVPVALAALVYGGGDFVKTLRAGVSYGRDCDSIAAMACGLHGAIFGADAMPQSLKTASDLANQRDYAQLASSFEVTIRAIHQGDISHFTAKCKSLSMNSLVEKNP